ncbi:hypothetical protein HY251_12490 [bacterium]|nr:hypothetical protein [bacterium]
MSTEAERTQPAGERVERAPPAPPLESPPLAAPPLESPPLAAPPLESPRQAAPTTKRAKLFEFARRLRDRFREQKEKDLAERAELAMAEGKIVRAPTRAEIVIALLRSLVFAPVLLVVVAIAFFILESIFGRAIEKLLSPPPYVPRRLLPLMFVCTCAFVLFLLQLLPKTRPRTLYTVRVHVLEKGNRDAFVLAFVAFIEYSPCLLATIFA